jgi:polysaccharide export outer membrane protein
MRISRFLVAIAAALLLAACARHQTAYVIDPSTGQPVPVVSQQYAQAPAPQQYAPASAPQYAQAYAQPAPAPQPQPQVAQAQAQSAPSGGRGFFTSHSSEPQAYQPPPAQQPYTLQYAPPPQPQYATPQPQAQYSAPQYAQPQYAQPQYAQPQYVQPQYAQPRYAAPSSAGSYAYAYAAPEQPYTLDAGDRLRIVVFGQDGISNSYIVDAGGNVNLPLIGIVPARGYTTQQLAQVITDKLKQGYVREPHVSVEVENYRPFFILGEVTTPGQYAYVANMTAETAVAIAGGFAPRAYKKTVKLTRNTPGQQFSGEVPLNTPLRPGDTIVIKERWF